LMIYNNDHDDFWEQVKFKIKHNGKFWIFQALKSVSSESLNDKI
jgi:hypothetical protein